MSGVASALRADRFEPPACALLRRGKQARHYNFDFPNTSIVTHLLRRNL
jgi:hypothetical protein